MHTPQYPHNRISSIGNLTILMIASPRHSDVTEGGSRLLQNLASTIRALSTPVETIVVFDGMFGRHKYNSTDIWNAYQSKISQVISAGNSSVVVHREWLHSAEAIRRVMLRVQTPLVFVMQEDQMLSGSTLPLPKVQQIVDSMIRPSPASELPIQSVHFPQLNQAGLKRKGDCICYTDWTKPYPCKRHKTLPLCSTHTFNDAPHLATRAHYMTDVWPIVPADYRTTVEHQTLEYSPSWKGWLYAGPGYCVHTKTPGKDSSYGARTGFFGE